MPAYEEILESIKEGLTTSAPDLRKKLIDLMLADLNAERLAHLKKAIDKAGDLKRDLQKARPDLITYGADGNKLENWSKEKFDAKNALEQQINKLDDALGKAFGGDFQKLKEIIK